MVLESESRRGLENCRHWWDKHSSASIGAGAERDQGSPKSQEAQETVLKSPLNCQTGQKQAKEQTRNGKQSKDTHWVELEAGARDITLLVLQVITGQGRDFLKQTEELRQQICPRGEELMHQVALQLSTRRDRAGTGQN